MIENSFNPSGFGTLGIALLKLQLIPGGMDLIEAADRLKPEMTQSMLELNSSCRRRCNNHPHRQIAFDPCVLTSAAS